MAENNDPPVSKRGIGRPFAPGQSGNPGGRPKQLAAFKKWLEEEAYPKAQRALIECLDDVNDPKTRMIAVKEVHDRLFGKAPQAITGEDGGPVRVDMTPYLERLAGIKRDG